MAVLLLLSPFVTVTAFNDVPGSVSEAQYEEESSTLPDDDYWDRTIELECIVALQNECSAQYTENKESIVAAESMGLRESIVDFSTARGSTITAHPPGADVVIHEVLADGGSEIEYLILLTEDITGFDFD